MLFRSSTRDFTPFFTPLFEQFCSFNTPSSSIRSLRLSLLPGTVRPSIEDLVIVLHQLPMLESLSFGDEESGNYTPPDTIIPSLLGIRPDRSFLCPILNSLSIVTRRNQEQKVVLESLFCIARSRRRHGLPISSLVIWVTSDTSVRERTKWVAEDDVSMNPSNICPWDEEIERLVESLAQEIPNLRFGESYTIPSTDEYTK